MKRILAGVLLCVVLLAPAQAADAATGAAAVRVGAFLPLADAEAKTTCDEATLTVGDQLVFEATGALLPGQTTGRMCATATLALDLPAMTTSLRLDVSSQRSGSVPGQNAGWTLEVTDSNGASLATLEGASGAQALDVPAAGPVVLVWSFDIPLLLPMQEVRVIIQEAEYTAEAQLPAASVVQREYRAGTLRVEEASVSVELDKPVADITQTLLLSVADHFRFDALVLPDGQRIEAATTAEPAADTVRLERAAGLLTVHVPKQIVSSAGAGTYELVARATHELQPNPALTPLAVVVLALPLTLAVMAERGARAFEREAFGHFALAARRLRLGTLLLAVFYGVVFVAALVGGRAPLMTVWPLNLEGWLLYLQALAAIAAFTGLHIAARQLRKIVTPPPVE